MLRYTKCILVTSFVFVSTFTIVYAAVSREVKQDKADVVYRIYREVKSDKKSEISLLVSEENQDSTDIAERSDLQQVDWDKVFSKLDFFSQRNIGNNILASALENTGLSNAFRADFTPKYIKPSEELFSEISKKIKPVVNILDSKTHIKSNPENFAIIPVSYAINAQSQQKPKIDTNIYIETRTKVAYLQTLLDTLKEVKQSGKSIHLDHQIYHLAHTQLKKNIRESSNYQTLINQFNNNIPKEESWLLAEHEREYVKFVREQIELAGKIKEFETSVTNIMLENERSNKWANQIAEQVKQELDNQVIRALW